MSMFRLFWDYNGENLIKYKWVLYLAGQAETFFLKCIEKG